ncbi:hypothetical protein B0H14DRAFT_3144735 [Mycena olivaceomarginata]|nr:hypothetical protein B0H14DRAFT_3144735 [Mycena olivaceomarginata]
MDFRDHTGKILHLTVIPNNRDEDAIGHVYLDFVESTGEMPMQLTFDGGNETGLMKALQQELRCRFLADKLTELDWPSTVTLKSTDNIPIESLWSYWQTYAGRNIKEIILQGTCSSGCGPRIVQLHLDEFQDHWNTTPHRSQKFKLLPTAAPEMIFFYPERYDILHSHGGNGVGSPGV